MNDSYTLNTPEQVDLAYDVAGLGTRAIAAIVDTLVQIVVLVALIVCWLVIAAVGAEGLRRLSGGEYGRIIMLIAIALAVLLLFVITTGYYIFFEMVWNGQSPGKRIVGIRVLTVNGQPITLGQSLIRNLVRIVDSLPSSYMLGAVVMLLNSRSQRLGDLAAGTIVVKISREASPRILAGLAAGRELPPQQAAAFDAEDVALARDFLLRRHEIAEPHRAALAERIAARLRGRLGPEAAFEQPEALIARIAAVRR